MHEMFCDKTRAEITADTLVFIPHKITFPEVKAEDFLKQAATDIISILTQPNQNSLIPSLQNGNETKNALLQLATILGQAEKEPDTQYQHLPQATSKTLNKKPDPPEERIAHVSTLTPLQKTLSALIRVMKYKQEVETNKIYQYVQPSYKSRATNFLIKEKKFEYNFNKMFHVYTHDNSRIIPLDQWHNPKLFHIYDNNRKKMPLDKLLQGQQKDVWNRASSNEFGRLAQGNKYGNKFCDVMEFIHKSEVPSNNHL